MKIRNFRTEDAEAAGKIPFDSFKTFLKDRSQIFRERRRDKIREGAREILEEKQIKEGYNLHFSMQYAGADLVYQERLYSGRQMERPQHLLPSGPPDCAGRSDMILQSAWLYSARNTRKIWHWICRCGLI